MSNLVNYGSFLTLKLTQDAMMLVLAYRETRISAAVRVSSCINPRRDVAVGDAGLDNRGGLPS